MSEKNLSEHGKIPVVEMLSEIMAERDKVAKMYKKEGGEPIVIHHNAGGAENAERNPLLMTWMGLNKSALEYWRELGLTPASYRKLTDEPVRPKARVDDPLERVQALMRGK